MPVRSRLLLATPVRLLAILVQRLVTPVRLPAILVQQLATPVQRLAILAILAPLRATLALRTKFLLGASPSPLAVEGCFKTVCGPEAFSIIEMLPGRLPKES